MRGKIVRWEGETLASGGVGTLRLFQRLVLVVTRAVTFSAEEAVLEGVVVGDVSSGLGFKLTESVSGVGGGAKERTEERLQIGLQWVEDNSAVVEAFMCSSRWR